LGQQQLRVGKSEAESSIENALSEGQAFGLKKDSAIEVIKRVVVAVDKWKDFFRVQGVKERDLEQMAQYIDGPTLKPQRAAFRT
jgi:serine/threonine-protein kinase HipA